MGILKKFKFWLYDVFKKDFIKMWIFEKGHVLQINNEEIDRIEPVSILGRFYNIDISKSLKQKNHYTLFYEICNSSPIEFIEKKVKYTNKDLSNLINHKIVNQLFNFSSIENIIIMGLTGGTLAGVLYLILLGSGMGV
jgi:hypothetical protein